MRGLLKKGVEYLWTADIQQEFLELRKLTTQNLILNSYERNIHLKLYVDASFNRGFGFVLGQDIGGKMNVIQCGPPLSPALRPGSQSMSSNSRD